MTGWALLLLPLQSLNWGWIFIRTERRGGARAGAGRKPLDEKRSNRSIKAFDEEWVIINQFADLVKHWDKEKCKKAVLRLIQQRDNELVKHPAHARDKLKTGRTH